MPYNVPSFNLRLFVKINNLRAFEKHVGDSAPNHFSNVYLLISKEPYERKSALDKLRAHLQHEPKTFDGDSLNAGEVLDELNSLSFFSKQNVVIIHNVDKPKKADLQALEDYFVKPNSRSFLLMTATSFSAATNFYKKVEKVGVIMDIPAEKPWEREKTVAEWLHYTAAAMGKKISMPVCQALIKQAGSDQAVLEQELHKLVCYIGDRAEITLNDARAICLVTNTETIWQLGDAIFRRDAGTAIRIFRSLENEGSHFLSLLRQIRGQFQTGLQISSIISQGGTPDQVTALFPYMKGGILDRNIKTVREYGLNRYVKGLQLIDETDLQAKNSGGDTDLLTDMLIVRLTQ